MGTYVEPPVSRVTGGQGKDAGVDEWNEPRNKVHRCTEPIGLDPVPTDHVPNRTRRKWASYPLHTWCPNVKVVHSLDVTDVDLETTPTVSTFREKPLDDGSQGHRG